MKEAHLSRISVTYIINRSHFVAPFIPAFFMLFTHFSLRLPTITSRLIYPRSCLQFFNPFTGTILSIAKDLNNFMIILASSCTYIY